MYFSNHVLEDIRQGNDIVEVVKEYVPLEARGNDHFGLCPFHREDTPSFSVSEDKQFYYCFGCGASGNVFGFVMAMNNITFPEAVEELAERIHYEIPRDSKADERFLEQDKMRKVHVEAAKYYHKELMGDKGEAARNYFFQRGIQSDVSKKFGLGFTGEDFFGLSDFLKKEWEEEFLIKAGLSLRTKKGGLMDRFRERLLFPIFDAKGQVIGFGGRSLKDVMPKYLNSPETLIFNKKRTLYGLNFARQSKKDTLILVEGYLDVIKLSMAGFDNGAATMGTAVSLQHAKEVKKYFDNVILLFDGDSAGEEATKRAIPFFLTVGITPKVLALPLGYDPDDYITEMGEIAFSDYVKEHIENHILYQVRLFARGKNMENFGEAILFQKEIAALLHTIQSPIERHNYIKEIAKIYEIDEDTLGAEIKMLSADKNKEPVFIPPTRRTEAPKEKKTSKSINEAREQLLYFASQSKKYATVIATQLEPKDFQNPLYERIFEYIIQSMQEKDKVDIADIISIFETVEEQGRATKIFMEMVEPTSINQKEEIIENQIRLLLQYKITEQIEKAAKNNDLESINIFQKKLTKLMKTKFFVDTQ